MFSRLLIANRGEIACRIIRTCRRLGIHTIAVYSSADADARHVREADEAVAIGSPEPGASYLRVDRIIDAAHTSGADAIHPGYGFLSENPLLAGACQAAGIAFVGPPAEVIRTMGSKRRARHIMAEAGIPVVPGYDGDQQDDQSLLEEARRIGLPVILKPSSGGGGKGMRIIRQEQRWEEVLAGARRESRAAFGDDHMIVERYLDRPRHVEVQVFADGQGNVVHLFERECSIQRRHQKVIEEAPSPAVDAALRSGLTGAAVASARTVGYVNAGTVEFLLDEDGGFYFMEMNTRLQVEHPVTEAITGVDLVEWQLRVAAGEPLPVTQDEIARHGHAIEARVYAENPFNDFLPSTGRIGRFVHPPAEALDLRVDTGFADGDTVLIHYDPMIAKIIAWGENRDEAVDRLRRALARTMITGPTTNLPLLRKVAGHQDFLAAVMDTGYLDRHLGDVLCEGRGADDVALIAAACALQTDAVKYPASALDPHSPWDHPDGWRPGGGGVRMRFEDACGEARELRLSGYDGRYTAFIGERAAPVVASRLDPDHLDIRIGDEEHQATVLTDGQECFVGLDFGGFEIRRVPLFRSATDRHEEDLHPVAPMPGRIVAVHTAEGDTVEAGQPLLVLEGMKMEYTLAAPVCGVVSRIYFREGDMVEADTTLIDIDAAAGEAK
jgi:3-methylcrotonyl-CoA carboxylase alpha subunit